MTVIPQIVYICRQPGWDTVGIDLAKSLISPHSTIQSYVIQRDHAKIGSDMEYDLRGYREKGEVLESMGALD